MTEKQCKIGAYVTFEGQQKLYKITKRVSNNICDLVDEDGNQEVAVYQLLQLVPDMAAIRRWKKGGEEPA